MDREAFRELRKQTTALARKKKEQFYTSKIRNASSKPKMLFKVVNTLMGRERVTVLPTAYSDTLLANNFQLYFKDKILKIRKSIISMDFTSTETFPENIQRFNTFELATEDEIRAIVRSFGVSCSPEDPLPAKLMTDHIDVLLPYWLEIVNLSLSMGSMDCLKSAIISPLLKETYSVVDDEQFKNYRPVSNLMFLSKLIERCVTSRLEKHMKDNNLQSKHQYGYRKGHSTEMLLVKIVDSLLTAFDKKLATVLLLLDLNAAFDTVEQTKLLHMLRYEIGRYEWHSLQMVSILFKGSYPKSEDK